jgi:hypothetical protein
MEFKERMPGEVLRVAEDRQVFADKLAEYKTRDLEGGSFRLASKIEILERLVEQGEVDTAALEQELRAKYPEEFNERHYRSAVGVIRDYIATGGKRVFGGTGLPKHEADEPEGQVF